MLNLFISFSLASLETLNRIFQTAGHAPLLRAITLVHANQLKNKSSEYNIQILECVTEHMGSYKHMYVCTCALVCVYVCPFTVRCAPRS